MYRLSKDVLFRASATLLLMALTIPSSYGCGIWGQLFCDYCWDGQFTSGVDSPIANAQVNANCTVLASGGKTVYYWGSDTTDSKGNFQASITGTSDKLGTLTAEASFLKGLFLGSSFLLGQLAGTKVVGCQISVSNTGSCSTLSYNDGSFLTNGARGNGWSSSQVSLHQYALTSLADIYVGPGGSNDYSVSCSPATRGQGSSKACPTLASPPPPPPGSKGDPHFTGADNSHYDFTGEPGNSYCLVSDSHLHINALYGGRFDQWGDNPSKPLTWMRSIAILWGQHTITLHARQGARWQYDSGYMAAMEVDGRAVSLNQAGDSLSLLDGALEMSWLAAKLPSGDDLVDVYSLKIEGVLMMRMTLRPEVPLLRTLQDGVVHFNLEFPQAQLSDSAHGVLGQTFRSDHRFRILKQKVQFDQLLQTEVVPGDNAEGFLDGTVDDYLSSSLLAPDCKFARFSGQSSRTAIGPAGVQLTSSSATSILGAAISRKMLIKSRV